jgi:S1 RNA binding domain protein
MATPARIVGTAEFNDRQVFVAVDWKDSGLVHISEITDGYVADIGDHVKEGEEVRARVLDVAPDGKICLSMRNVNDER